MIPAEDFTELVIREQAAFGDGPLFDVTEMIALLSRDCQAQFSCLQIT
jgi:hypothetical protein